MAQIHRVAWTVTNAQKEGQKDFWTRVGRSFLNKDGSETILFDALPLNGKIILRDPKREPVAEEAEPQPEA